ncbi:MAG: DUF4358 domain-containing protein [Ruminococcus sp.]|nr:DUF4358 domain-containing protein [Ruminococcus sp.]
MRKFSFISVILCLMFLFAFTGCTGDTDSKEVVLSDVLASINSKFAISENEMMWIETADDLELYYNIAPADVKQFAAETTVNSATDITEIILVEAVDSDSAQRVYDALQIRYNSQRDLCASYSAELLAIVNECSVARNGNYIALIMSSDFDDITEWYNSYFD